LHRVCSRVGQERDREKSVSAHAVAIGREDGTLALLLRVVRSPSGIYVIAAAGQERKGHNPHWSWHSNGRVHDKSFGRPFNRRRGQPLDGFTGVEPFVCTGTTRADAPLLPDCYPREFDGVMDVSARLLNDLPSGTQVHVELLGPGAEPAVLRGLVWRLLQRFVITDGTPAIAVSFYDVHIG